MKLLCLIVATLIALRAGAAELPAPNEVFNKDINPSAALAKDNIAGFALLKLPTKQLFASDNLSVTMNLQAVNWDYAEKKWHFFMTMGVPDSGSPYIYLYLQLNGKLRLVVSKNKTDAIDIVTAEPIDWAEGSWHHIAFTIESLSNDKSKISLYLDGKLAGTQYPAFQIKNLKNLPTETIFGDQPMWNPQSAGKTRLGNIQIYNELLSAEIIGIIGSRPMQGTAI
jgi:hypothetical protein